MKSNIQNQRGYALFIVMGLMVLATIGVMATYKAASSYDDKSGASFKNRGAKEVTEAGTRAVESYLTDNTMDAVGVLQQMYKDKMDSTKDVSPIKVPLGALNGSSSLYDVFLTDVDWDQKSRSLFVKAEIIGTGIKGDTSMAAQGVMYKVSGLTVDSLGYTDSFVANTDCSPDVALYLGGDQKVNLTKSLYINGGLYSTSMQMESGKSLTVIGNQALSGAGVFPNWYRSNFDLDSGNYFLSHAVLVPNGTFTFPQSLEFAEDAYMYDAYDNTNDLNIAGNFYLRDWTGYVDGNTTINVGGDLIVKEALTVTGSGRLTINVDGNVILFDGISKNTTGDPRLSINLKGDLLLYGNITYDVSGGAGYEDEINGLISTRVYSSLGSFPVTNNNVLCGGGACTLESIEDTAWTWVDPHIFVSDEMGLDSTDNFKKNMDIQISDSMSVKELTWREAWQAGYDEGVAGVSTAPPADWSPSFVFKVATANALASDAAFVSKYGFNGFLVINLDDGVSAKTTQKFYDASGQGKLLGSWVFKTGNKSMDFTGGPCFAETDSTARVLLWATSNAKFTVCDADSDGISEFYGMVYYDYACSSCNNLFDNDINIHGSVYTSSGNANALLGGSDSIWLDQDVLRDISPVGLMKLDAAGNLIMNCVTGEDSTGNVPMDSSVYNLIERLLEAKSSQLSVKRVGVVQNMKIDDTKSLMDSMKADVMLAPYVGFSMNTLSVENNKFASFKDVMDTTKFKGMYQINGKRTGCTTTWEDGNASSIDITGFADTTIAVKYTVSCPNAREVSKKMMLVFGSGMGSTGTSITNSSTDNASSSSVATSSTANSSVETSSAAGSSTALSSAAVDPSCAIYPLWDPSVSYAKDEFVRGNAGAVFSCVASDLDDCSNVFTSGSADAINIWYYQGTCIDNVELDTITWVTPVHNAEYTIGDEVDFGWYNSTQENVNISFKLEGDADWTSNAYSTSVATSDSGSYSWKFETDTGEGEGKMYFKIELENTVGVSNVIAVTVKAASSDICDGEAEFIKGTTNAATSEKYIYSNTLWQANQAVGAWDPPSGSSGFWTELGACGESSGTSSAVNSSSTASGGICVGVAAWENRNYTYSGSKEYVVYNARLYSHKDWVNSTTPDVGSGWTDEGACN